MGSEMCIRDRSIALTLTKHSAIGNRGSWLTVKLQIATADDPSDEEHVFHHANAVNFDLRKNA